MLNFVLIQFDTWLDDLRLYLLSDSKDSISLFDIASGAATAPPATADSATRSQWLTRDAAARLAIRNHLLLAKCAHFGQHRTAWALYDAVVIRYSSPATATLGRLLLPYLFPELSAFAMVEDLVSHLRASDARYRATILAEFLDRNLPPMFITLYFIVTRLLDSLCSVRDHFLSLDPTSLTVDLLKEHLRAAKTSAVAVGAARGTPHTPFFEECSPSPLAPSYASAAAVNVPGAEVERPCWEDQLRSGVAIFDLDFDVLLSAMYALTVSAEGEWCVPTDPGIAAAALGASESGTLPGIGPAEALNTFTLNSGASRCFFRDRTTLTLLPAPIPVQLADPSEGLVVTRSSTVLPCSAVLSGSLSGLHLPSFSTNLVSTAALQDAMVTTTTLGGQRSSLYTLATEPPRVAASAHVSASGQVAPPCSCRLQSHQTLLWHHRLGHPSLPRLRGMHSRLLVSGLPRSLPPLPPSPAPPCLPCFEGRQRAAPHSSLFPPTNSPLQTLHMDVWGPACVSGQGRERYVLLVVDDYTRYTTVFPLRSKGQDRYFLLVVDDFTRYTTVFPLECKGDVCAVLIPWIRAVRRQLSAWFHQDLPVLRLHSNRGGEFSSHLLNDFYREEGITQSFMLLASLQHNGIGERRIGLIVEVACTSMIHAAAPHFLWPFAVRYVAPQLNIWPRVSHPETSPTLLWTGEVGNATAFWVWGSFTTRSRATSCPPASSPLTSPGYPPGDPLPPLSCPALSGVSQVSPPPLVEPVEVSSDPTGPAKGGDPGADDTVVPCHSLRLETPPSFLPRRTSLPLQPVVVDSSATGGGDARGAGSEGAGPRVGDSKGAGSGCASSEGVEPCSRGGAQPSLPLLGSVAGGAGFSDAGGAGAGDAGGFGAGGAGARGGAGAGGAGAFGAGARGAGGSGARGSGAGGAGGFGAGGARAGGTGSSGAVGAGARGACGSGAGGAGVGGAGGSSAGGSGAGSSGAGGPARHFLLATAATAAATTAAPAATATAATATTTTAATTAAPLSCSNHLLAAETSAVAVGVAHGTPHPPFFDGCSPSPLAPSYASAAAVDVLSTEDVGTTSASAKHRIGNGKGGGSGGGGSGSGGGGSSGGSGSSGGGGTSGSGGGSGGIGGGGGGSDGSGGCGSGGSGGVRTRAQLGGSGGGQRQQQQRRSETPSPQQLREWLFQRGASGGSVSCPYVIRTGDRTDYDAILSAMYALSASAEGGCYRCVPPDPRIEVVALGAGESSLPGTAPAQALHTFTLDSGASHSFFHDNTTLTPLPAPVPVRLADPSRGLVAARSSTVLPCPAVPSGSLPSLHLPSFSTNLVSTAALQDAMVTTTTPGGQRLLICTCTRTGRHLATFTHRLGSSLYTLSTEPPQVAASAQVSASGQVAAPCSCRLLSHQTLLWHHRLGHPSLPRLRGMHSRLLVSGLPRSLPPLPPSPAPPCLPCVEGRQRAAPHSSFPPTTAPLQNLHMDIWGPARVSGQGRESYFLLVVDDYMRYTTVFPLRSKGQYAAHQLNLSPRVSWPETSPTLRWTGEVGDASVFQVWGSRAFVCNTSADKLSPRGIPCVFLGFVPDAPGWQFYHPNSRRIFPSQDVTFDESVPFYRLFPYHSAPLPPPPLFLAPGPPPVDPLPPQGPAPSGVSHVDPLLGPAPVQ
ncbi:unnamed protein product, partial [Closterium sp. NIES-54]